MGSICLQPLTIGTVFRYSTVYSFPVLYSYTLLLCSTLAVYFCGIDTSNLGPGAVCDVSCVACCTQASPCIQAASGPCRLASNALLLLMQMDTAMQQGSLDNITVIVVQLADMQRSNAADAADTRPPHLKNRFKAPASAL